MGKRKADCTPEEWAVYSEKRKAREAKWRAENPEKVREKARKWYAKHPEKVEAQNRKWRTENPEKHKAARKAAYTELRPYVVANRLRIPVAKLTPELLELKREQLLMHRLTKQLESTIKEKNHE